MVTMKSGKATLTMVPQRHSGDTHTGVAQAQTIWAAFNCPCKAATAMPTASTHGTAQRGKKRRPNRYAPAMQSTKTGA